MNISTIDNKICGNYYNDLKLRKNYNNFSDLVGNKNHENVQPKLTNNKESYSKSKEFKFEMKTISKTPNKKQSSKEKNLSYEYKNNYGMDIVNNPQKNLISENDRYMFQDKNNEIKTSLSKFQNDMVNFSGINSITDSEIQRRTKDIIVGRSKIFPYAKNNSSTFSNINSGINILSKRNREELEKKIFTPNNNVKAFAKINIDNSYITPKKITSLLSKNFYSSNMQNSNKNNDYYHQLSMNSNQNSQSRHISIMDSNVTKSSRNF